MEKNKYRISYNIASNHMLDIVYRVEDIAAHQCLVQLPAWRPGRYELGNFAKNIQKFRVIDLEGRPLGFRKRSSHLWEIDAKGCSAFECHYTYYAADLNAGSTFLDDNQLYVNPVNCLMYEVNSLHLPCEVELEMSEHYGLASSLPNNGSKLYAADCHELFDSPFIASHTLNSYRFFVMGVEVFLHFQGVCRPDFEKLEADFSKFFMHQVQLFGDFPGERYHFLFQILPNSFHHGVEHQHCTVIAMGPGHSQFTTGYKEFLGISSHELFHAWNIKAIRPAELLPYDYTRENYSNLGYVAEGVTTLMGDLTLLRSGVWTIQDFLDEFSRECQKHFDNFGRHNYSVAQSGFDSWLDGYVSGIPYRKVSIYTEGMLLAFICDIMICRNTGFSRSLYDVMYSLYQEYSKKGKGYTEEDYIRELEKASGHGFREFFEQYVWKPGDDQPLLEESLAFLGLVLEQQPSVNFAERHVGIKMNSNGLITAVYPGSSAERCGLWLDDRIVAINGVEAAAETSAWMEYFKGETMRVAAWRSHYLVHVDLTVDDQVCYRNYKVKMSTAAPSENLQRWLQVKRSSK